MTDITLPDLDRAIGFTIPEQHARGRLVRLGPVLDEILAAHAYPPVIERLLAEALTRLPVGRAASEVAKALGLDRKTLYARALVMKGDASEA